MTGASYVVPAAAHVSFARTPVADGDTVTVDEGLVLRALATPGHTPHDTSYVLAEDGHGVAAFTGGSSLIGTVGPARPGRAPADRGAGACPAGLRAPAGRRAGRRGAGAAHPRLRQLLLLLAGRGGRDHDRPGAQLTLDVDTFVAELLTWLDDVPAYYAHMFHNLRTRVGTET